jgi:hypothetical protein
MPLNLCCHFPLQLTENWPFFFARDVRTVSRAQPAKQWQFLRSLASCVSTNSNFVGSTTGK